MKTGIHISYASEPLSLRENFSVFRRVLTDVHPRCEVDGLFFSAKSGVNALGGIIVAEAGEMVRIASSGLL